MKCEQCHNEMMLSRFIMESLNIFRYGKHICPHCKHQYKISLRVFLFWIYSVGLGRCLKYIFVIIYSHYDSVEIFKALVVRIIFIYLCCVFQQIIYWINRKN